MTTRLKDKRSTVTLKLWIFLTERTLNIDWSYRELWSCSLWSCPPPPHSFSSFNSADNDPRQACSAGNASWLCPSLGSFQTTEKWPFHVLLVIDCWRTLEINSFQGWKLWWLLKSSRMTQTRALQWAPETWSRAAAANTYLDYMLVVNHINLLHRHLRQPLIKHLIKLSSADWWHDTVFLNWSRTIILVCDSNRGEIV